MLISRIDHVSIAVRNRDRAEQFFRDILGAVEGFGMEDHETRYAWRLFSLGDLSRLEIISPTGEGSFLEGFLKNREGGVHHISLQTPDLRETMARLEAHGIPFFGYHEYPGGVFNEVFIHPRHAFGVLIQIAEFRADDWLSETVKLPAGKRWRVEKRGGGAAIVFSHPGGGTVTLELDKGELKRLMDSLAEAATTGEPGSTGGKPTR